MGTTIPEPSMTAGEEPAAMTTAGMAEPISGDQATVVPANEASWEDLQAVFGTTGYAVRCQCQRLKAPGCFWRDFIHEERMGMLESRPPAATPTPTPPPGWSPTSTASLRAGPPSSRARRTRRCAPHGSRGAAATRTRTTTVCGR